MNLKSFPKHQIERCAVIVSFDVEATYHIQAKKLRPLSHAHYLDLMKRVANQMQWLRKLLDRFSVRATFFWVGELAWRFPYLVRTLQRDGHEIACHGWAHRALTEMNEEECYQDIQKSKSVLEDILGSSIWGFRAPTFSVTKETAFAVSILAELGFVYDSSIYPILHDRYGISKAPRRPFLVRYYDYELLEFPPATLQLGPLRLGVGGGGHFRFWPLWLCQAAIRQLLRSKSYVMLYFHPWEFDPDQPVLPLSQFQRWRTYTGISHMPRKLERLLSDYKFVTAKEAVKELDSQRRELPRYILENCVRH